MTLFFLSLIIELRETLLERHHLLIYTAIWTIFTAFAVAVAAISPEVAYVWAISSSYFVGECGGAAIRLPLDAPQGEIICVPTELFNHTSIDFLVPPIFAAAVVGGATCAIRVVGLWEAEDDSS